MRDAERLAVDPLIRAMVADDLLTVAEAEHLFGVENDHRGRPLRDGDEPRSGARLSPRTPEPSYA